ncbi:MAG: hypothetical protein AB2A00_40880 [Myxococcota bacterium]
MPEFWMHLLVPTEAPLRVLDEFLRETWLECCGHLSKFTIGRTDYELNTGGVDAMWPMMFGRRAARSMDVPMVDVLRPGEKFFHEYDFGTTTSLALHVQASTEAVMPRDGVRLLARNHLPAITCTECGAAATQVCTDCLNDGTGWLCAGHARQHECDSEMLLPVVNSPRLGQCGYTGPVVRRGKKGEWRPTAP